VYKNYTDANRYEVLHVYSFLSRIETLLNLSVYAVRCYELKNISVSVVRTVPGIK